MNARIGWVAENNGAASMKRLLFGLALVVWTLAGDAKAETGELVEDQVPPALTFDQIIDDIENAPAQIRDGQIAVEGILGRDIAALNYLIENNAFPPQYRPVVHYYRALALSALNSWNEQQGKGNNRELALLALDDLQLTIGDGSTLPGLLKDAEYTAGLIALNELKDARLAYEHFARCAELGQAGCLNIMASARLTGEGGQAIDIAEAIALHEDVYATGTTYTCAGAYSALDIAVITQLSGVENEARAWHAWMQNAYRLLDSLDEKYPGQDRCSRALFEIREYLLRLANGEENKDLLESARTISVVPAQVLTASYLLGAMDADGFAESMTTVTDVYERCYGIFAALWAANSHENPVLAGRFRVLLFDLDSHACSVEQALSRYLTIGE